MKSSFFIQLPGLVHGNRIIAALVFVDLSPKRFMQPAFDLDELISSDSCETLTKKLSFGEAPEGAVVGTEKFDDVEARIGILKV